MTFGSSFSGGNSSTFNGTCRKEWNSVSSCRPSLKYAEGILNDFWRELHELDTYFLTCRRHSTRQCCSFDAGRHLSRCGAAGGCDLNAACEQPAVIPC